MGTFNGKSKYKIICLHNYILNANKREIVDHKDHDPFNNKKNNLRISKSEENTKNRKSKNSNNKSGYRNVFWNKKSNSWEVHLQINKKNNLLGKFDDVHEAGKFAEEMRKKYYGKYKGVS